MKHKIKTTLSLDVWLFCDIRVSTLGTLYVLIHNNEIHLFQTIIGKWVFCSRQLTQDTQHLAITVLIVYDYIITIRSAASCSTWQGGWRKDCDTKSQCPSLLGPRRASQLSGSVCSGHVLTTSLDGTADFPSSYPPSGPGHPGWMIRGPGLGGTSTPLFRHSWSELSYKIKFIFPTATRGL